MVEFFFSIETIHNLYECSNCTSMKSIEIDYSPDVIASRNYMRQVYARGRGHKYERMTIF
jgi:hypothetical protein